MPQYEFKHIDDEEEDEELEEEDDKEEPEDEDNEDEITYEVGAFPPLVPSRSTASFTSTTL